MVMDSSMDASVHVPSSIGGKKTFSLRKSEHIYCMTGFFLIQNNFIRTYLSCKEKKMSVVSHIQSQAENESVSFSSCTDF